MAGAEAGAELAEENGIGFSKERIKEIADNLPNESSALILIIEHLWAKDIKEALRNANGCERRDDSPRHAPARGARPLGRGYGAD